MKAQIICSLIGLISIYLACELKTTALMVIGVGWIFLGLLWAVMIKHS